MTHGSVTLCCIFLHGWFWWPMTVGHRTRGYSRSYHASLWTARYLRHARAMGARTL